MVPRFRDFIEHLLRPYGTTYTPAFFGLDDCAFFLAVLRACPAGSTLHLDQEEDELWVDRLREWSSRTSPEQFEADHYSIDIRFTDAVERLLAEHPSSLICVPHMAIVSPDGRCLLASVDNFTIITNLDADILKTLQDHLSEPSDDG